MTHKDQLTQHLPFVRRVAKRVHRQMHPPLEVEDLVSYGMLGLSEAVKRYSPDQGIPFESFAHYRVRGAILEGISEHCPVSRHVHRRLKMARRGTDYMEGVARDLGSSAPRTAARDATMLASTVRDLAAIYTVAQLAHPERSAETDLEFEDPSARAAAEEEASNAQLRQFVDRLPEAQRDLVRLYYFEDLTLEQVGRKLGYKKSWACKLHKSALARLREMMEPGPDREQ